MLDKCFILQTFRVTVNFRVRVRVWVMRPYITEASDCLRKKRVDGRRLPRWSGTSLYNMNILLIGVNIMRKSRVGQLDQLV